jgi:hypothetical protein
MKYFPEIFRVVHEIFRGQKVLFLKIEIFRMAQRYFLVFKNQFFPCGG